MNTELIIYCLMAALSTAGLAGWVYAFLGWEEKKMALWDEGKPAKKSLLQRYGLLLVFPALIGASEVNRISGSDYLGWILIVGTAAFCFVAPMLTLWFVGLLDRFR